MSSMDPLSSLSLPPSSTSQLSQELRRLKASHLQQLGQILSVQDQWKTLMGQIVHEDTGQKRFTAEHVRLLSDEVSRTGQTGLELLASEWGTMGRRRPTLRTLLTLCLDIKAWRAASYICKDMLNGETVTESNAQDVRRQLALLGAAEEPATATTTAMTTATMSTTLAPPEGAAAAAPDLDQWDQQLEEELLNLTGDGGGADLSAAADGGDHSAGDSSLAVSADATDNSDVFSMPLAPEHTFSVPCIPLDYLRSVTQDFGADRLVGRGGFADVFLGVTRRSGRTLAVKRLKRTDGGVGGDPAAAEAPDLLFNYEVGELTRLKHPSVIEILGYSNDRPRDALCLVYPYMKNGNVELHLQLRDGLPPLDERRRLSILVGVAEGLDHLHSQPKPLIHRDIKTSNILLDDKMQPKIADFGLLRHASKGETETVNIKGTPRYMAPEAARGDISVKIDVFSYGAVLLEVVTGLPSFDASREDKDIITHIQEYLNSGQGPDRQSKILGLLDAKADWSSPQKAEKLFEIGLACLEAKYKRPEMREVLMRLMATRHV